MRTLLHEDPMNQAALRRRQALYPPPATGRKRTPSKLWIAFRNMEAPPYTEWLVFLAIAVVGIVLVILLMSGESPPHDYSSAMYPPPGQSPPPPAGPSYNQAERDAIVRLCAARVGVTVDGPVTPVTI